jgi:predicted neutral ceramidase superfamily lipid hydrolase
LTDLGIQDEDKKKSRIRRYFKSHKIKALRKLAPLFLPMRVTLMINASILILLGYIISSLPDSVLLENSFGYDYLGLIFLLFLSIFVVTATSLVRKRGSESQAEISFFMIFFVGLIAFSAFRNNKSAHFIMKGNPKYTVTLKTNSNEIYATNDSILYIGGTKNFYFLYNRKTRGCYVVPSNIVVEAKVKRIRDGL